MQSKPPEDIAGQSRRATGRSMPSYKGTIRTFLALTKERNAWTWVDTGLFHAMLLVFWELVVRELEIRPSILPSPTRVLLELWRQAPLLRRHALPTAVASLQGLLPALAIAFTLSWFAAASARVRRLVTPVLAFMQRLPLLTLAPLMVVWFGYGIPSAAAASFLACFLLFAVHLRAGFDAVPEETMAIVHNMGAGAADVLLKVQLPTCLPFVLHSLRLAVTLSFTAVTVVEFIASDAGLGFLMQYAGSKADVTQLFAALAVLILMILIARGIILLFERSCISWPVEALGFGQSGRSANYQGSSLDRVT